MWIIVSLLIVASNESIKEKTDATTQLEISRLSLTQYTQRRRVYRVSGPPSLYWVDCLSWSSPLTNRHKMRRGIDDTHVLARPATGRIFFHVEHRSLAAVRARACLPLGPMDRLPLYRRGSDRCLRVKLIKSASPSTR